MDVTFQPTIQSSPDIEPIDRTQEGAAPVDLLSALARPVVYGAHGPGRGREQVLTATVLGPVLSLARPRTFVEAANSLSVDQLQALTRARFRAAEAREARSGVTAPWSDCGPVLGVHHVRVGHLVPGQDRISYQRARDKMVWAIEHGAMIYDAGSNRWWLTFDAGRALWPDTKPKTAVLAPGGRVVVTDGNHSVVASVMAGAETVPMNIVADYSHVSMDEFVQIAKAKGWLYLWDLGGRMEAADLSSYAQLKDDPLRYLVTEVAAKIDATGNLVEDTCFETAAWVKVVEAGARTSADFVEFKLADVLYRAAEHDPEVRALEAMTVNDHNRAQILAVVKQALARAVAHGELDPESERIQLL